MSDTEKTKARIELYEYLEVACRTAARAKDPVKRFVAAELEYELASRRKRLEHDDREPTLPLRSGTEG